MDILVIRSISRIAMILCGVGFIIYGIVLVSSTKEDKEKTEAAHKKGKSCIISGISLLAMVAMFIFL